MNHPHILLVCQSVQGNLNPSIQLATNLTCAGARVTIATPVSGFHKLKSQTPSNQNISFASFSDGHDDDANAILNPGYVDDVRNFGSKTLKALIQNLSEKGDYVNLVIYTLFLPFAAGVARELHVPSALFLIQSATLFWIYNQFCNSRDGIAILNDEIVDDSFWLELKGVTVFKYNDLPTFVLPTSPYFKDMVYVYQSHIKFLEEDPKSIVLVNSLDGLEPESMKTIKNAVVVGPLVGSTCLNKDRGSYFEWLDTKKEKSVVYVSFGSLAVLTKSQKVEVLYGLIESGKPFLMVLRDECDEEDVEIKGLKERIGENGLIVKWCSQMEVLRHRAIGCFVTHCGWNSTLESMVAGVAIVGCPQFSDQATNAKMVDEVWGNGVRAVVDENMVVGRDEIKRCLEVVMDGGDRAVGIREKVEKWKKVADESVKDGGCSMVNLKVFVESIV
ncbi:UDP-glycosyltransferase 75C1-like [Rutidosis leptorrhynchoides]|uniref:UDP-glycosyltransferase 75C1-like n=1 Tax=Rutidosis leptorrhynchoides TaxID=125765 RepID=UPI003A9A1DF6